MVVCPQFSTWATACLVSTTACQSTEWFIHHFPHFLLLLPLRHLYHSQPNLRHLHRRLRRCLLRRSRHRRQLRLLR
jgi:hypothetical protein